MPNSTNPIAAISARLQAAKDTPTVANSGGDWVSAGEVSAALLSAQSAVQQMTGGGVPRIATLLANEWQTGAFVLAAASEVSVLPLNPGLKTAALTALIADAQVDAVIGIAGDPRGTQLGAPFLPLEDILTAALPRPKRRDNRPELVLSTSGSTGTPKRVALPPAALLDRAQVIAETLRLGPQDRALHALPMFHIGAFVDLFLTPLLQGGSVVIAPQQGAQALWQTLAEARPSWIQLVPTMLQDMLRQRPAAPPVEQLRFVRSVSAGLTAELQAEAEAVFGCPVIQMYGMTETAGQICSNPLPDAPRKPLSVGPPTRIALQIRNTKDTPLQHGEVGEICVKGASVIASYDSSDDLGTAWLRTGDLGWQDAEGYLFLTGRVKEQINRGGEKISVVVIEQAALALPGVTEAAAFAVPHPTLGEAVGLAVVAKPGTTEAQILGQLSGHLAQFEMPRTVQILGAMPRLAGGKLDRRALAAAHRDRSDQGAAAAALSPADQRIANLWAEVLQSAPPHLSTDFFDAGGDSLAATTFILRLEEMLGHPVSPNVLFDHPSFGALLDAVSVPTSAAPDTRAVHYAKRLSAGWDAPLAKPGGLTRVLRPADDRIPFAWCCQGFDEAEHTAAWMTTGGFLVMPTLFLMKRRTEQDRDDLAAALAAELQALHPVGPLTLGGFCEGARMMERVAARLVQQGRVLRAFLCVDHKFEAEAAFPVLHVTSRDLLGYPDAAMSFPDRHSGGLELHRLDVHHDDIMRSLHRLKDVILPFLSGERTLPKPETRRIPEPERTALYSARITARPPWRWRAGTTTTVKVKLTNKSAKTWPPSAESGLLLMAMEANLLGGIENRFVGHAQWDRAIQPGETCEVALPITFDGRRRAVLLRLQLVDQGVADLPYRTGGLRIYPGLVLAGNP